MSREDRVREILELVQLSGDISSRTKGLSPDQALSKLQALYAPPSEEIIKKCVEDEIDRWNTYRDCDLSKLVHAIREAWEGK